MKIKPFLLTTIFVLFFILHSKAQDIDLTGTWKTKGKNTSLKVINFGSEKTFMMVMGNDTFGGKNYKDNGNAATLTYSVDFSVKPAHLNLIITEIESQKKTVAKCLLMVIKPNVIKIAFNFGEGERPKNFTVSNSGFFKKVQN